MFYQKKIHWIIKFENKKFKLFVIYLGIECDVLVRATTHRWCPTHLNANSMMNIQRIQFVSLFLYRNLRTLTNQFNLEACSICFVARKHCVWKQFSNISQGQQENICVRSKNRNREKSEHLYNVRTLSNIKHLNWTFEWQSVVWSKIPFIQYNSKAFGRYFGWYFIGNVENTMVYHHTTPSPHHQDESFIFMWNIFGKLLIRVFAIELSILLISPSLSFSLSPSYMLLFSNPNALHASNITLIKWNSRPDCRIHVSLPPIPSWSSTFEIIFVSLSHSHSIHIPIFVTTRRLHVSTSMCIFQKDFVNCRDSDNQVLICQIYYILCSHTHKYHNCDIGMKICVYVFFCYAPQ